MPINRRLAMLAGLMCAAGVIAPPVLAQKTPTGRLAASDEAAAASWLIRNAQPIASASPSAAELKSLVDRLRGARVIALGETSYGAHEELAFKAAVVRALVEAGRINAVAFVASYQTGKALDTYAGGGAGSAADVLRRSGMPRQWVTQELAELLDWLRAWNARPATTRIRIVGVDAQDPLRDTRTAMSLLSEVEPEAAGALQQVWKDVLTEDALKRPFADVVREWQRSQWESLNVAAQVLDDLLARPTTRLAQAPAFMDARNSARAARLGLAAAESFVGNPPIGSSPGDAYVQGDVALATQFLAMLGAPARAVLWGHDAQLSRSDAPAGSVANSGDVLADRLGSAYHVVGFAWRQGAFSVSGGDSPTRIALSPGSLGALLAKSGRPRAWFDLTKLPSTGWSKRWRAMPTDRGWLGGEAGNDRAPPTPLGTGVDIVVFFETMTPSRRLQVS